MLYKMEIGTYDPPLDPGISEAVSILNAEQVETFESCEGGDGHAYAEPTVRFYGDRVEGYRAFAVAVRHGLQVSALRQVWPISHEDQITGPWWELVFSAPRP